MWRTGLSAMSSLLPRFLRIWDKCLCSYSRRVQGLSGAKGDHVELQHTCAECPQKGSEAVYWEYELLMALWLGTPLWAQAPSYLCATGSSQGVGWQRRGRKKTPGWWIQAHKEREQRIFCWIIEKNPSLIDSNASFRQVLSLHEFSQIDIFATNTRFINESDQQEAGQQSR